MAKITLKENYVYRKLRGRRNVLSSFFIVFQTFKVDLLKLAYYSW